MAGFKWFQVVSGWFQVVPRFSKYGKMSLFVDYILHKNKTYDRRRKSKKKKKEK